MVLGLFLFVLHFCLFCLFCLLMNEGDKLIIIFIAHFAYKGWVALPSNFYFGWLKKKVTQPEIKIKLTTLGSHFNQVKIKNVNHAGNLTAGKLTFPRTNHAAEQDTLHRDYSLVVFSYSTTTKSTGCFCFADGKMDK